MSFVSHLKSRLIWATYINTAQWSQCSMFREEYIIHFEKSIAQSPHWILHWKQFLISNYRKLLRWTFLSSTVSIFAHISTHLCVCIVFLYIRLSRWLSACLWSSLCLCFPQDSGVQTILQASYESWGFWLHKAVRRKERKTDRGEEEVEHLLSSSTQRGRA